MVIDRLFCAFPEIESGRLALREIEDRHLDGVYELYSNEKVFEYCGILPKNNRATLKTMIGHFSRDFQKKSRVKWGIFFSDDPDSLLGIIEVFEIHQKVNALTLGYYLSESRWGQGIASEAVGLVVRFLFQQVKVNRIQAEVMPGNGASKRVLLRNGFKYEGTLRQAALWSGQGIVDLEIYGLLLEEYAL
ncbi:GNAT family N-acetyltransferase [Paenibacillus glufosinatiresistens]|uniref:GNAT family N-acetyltransferase n=1 Tax=Paenibacillus glufosinatiresistens TaxID=3070657 RepID=UPI00286DE675|nr:GNAT family protein [Paenibacillus sp. YX.27]